MEASDVCLCLLPSSRQTALDEAYLVCSCGDLVVIAGVYGAEYRDGAGVYATNRRTKKSGWLENFDHLHFKVVGCRGDIDECHFTADVGRGDICPGPQDAQPSAPAPTKLPSL